VQSIVNGNYVGGTFNVFIAGPDGATDHVLRVFTPNGESSAAPSAGNILTVL